MIGVLSHERADPWVQSVESLGPGNVVRLIEYNAYSHAEQQLDRAENVADASGGVGIRWLHFQGRPDEESLERLASQFRFHALTLETFKSDPGRSRIETHDKQLSIVLQIACSSPAGELVTEPLHLFLQDQVVITLLANNALDPFQTLRERVRDNGNHLRFLRSDYLVYSIFESTLAPYAAAIAQLADQRETLEQAILRDPSQELLPLISRTERTLNALRQIGLTQVETWGALEQDQSGAIGERTKPFFRSGRLRLLEMIDRLQTEALAATNLSNLYLGSLSSRTNASIRTFTLIASVCLPIIAIALLYAMSFFHSSSAALTRRWHDTYSLVILLMLACVAVTFWHFRRR
jgi:magnesium transporter